MTLDEAINILKQYIDYDNADVPDFYTMAEACEVVINALEQEPCDDCISRQAVLDTLDTADKFLDEDRTVERYKALLKESYEVLPPATPQEPLEVEAANLQKVYNKGFEDCRQAVLDKIRAEIDEQYDRVHPYDISCAEGLEMALGIVDKYKAEGNEE